VIHVYTFVMGPGRKPIDLTLIHLAFSNTIIICTTGVRDIATVFYFRNFIGNVAYKTLIYLGRVSQGLSICTTCLLSMVRAVIISPSTTLRRKLKPQTAWQALPYHLLFRSLILWIAPTCSSISQQSVAWIYLKLECILDIGVCYHLGK
jgi:vomeronasal1 receptor